MFQATAEEFKAAVVARCFIVGFRFYRQSPANKARLAYGMSSAVQTAVFGTVRPLSDFYSNNLLKLFTAVAEAHHIVEPENWAARVLLLSSTMFMSSAAVCVAAQVEVSADTKEAIIAEFERHMVAGDADANQIRLAVSGHTRLSLKFSLLVPEHYITVYDEDGYPASADEIPAMPEHMILWQEALDARRREQLAALVAYNESQSADSLSDAMADALGEAPEYDENLNREDVEAGYTCNATSNYCDEERPVSSSAQENDDLDR